MSAPVRLGVTGQAEAIASGALDAREVLDGSLTAIAEAEPALGAVVDVFAAEAHEMLAVAPPGRLHGVPLTLKDMLAVPWRAPRDGTGLATDPPGAASSAVFERLRAEGAVIVGITNMHQLGVGSTGHISADGPTANPWSLDRCGGGSSGGAAASVAVGITEGAVGSDGGGSVRIPAAYCGVTGLKPTWGAIPVDGYTGAYSSLGAIGPLASDSAGCRLLFEVLSGRDATSSSRAPARLALLTASWDVVAPEVAAACSDAVAVLHEAGVLAAPEPVVEGLEHVMVAAVLGNGIERAPSLTPEWFERMEPALHPNMAGLLKTRFVLPASVLLRVTRLRTLLRRELARVFATVDLLAWPTVPAPAPPIARPVVELPEGRMGADMANVRQCGLANLTGIPAISIPCGFAGGLPVGLMLHAPWGREDLLLDVAERFEAATARAFVDARPPLLPAAARAIR
jgi:Asp-tRNA(Asn)/Glu-tRNA(Gln) amidotransferase A subunit family amidase